MNCEICRINERSEIHNGRWYCFECAQAEFQDEEWWQVDHMAEWELNEAEEPQAGAIAT